VEGGAAVPLAAGNGAISTPDWGEDGNIYFGTRASLRRISGSGGQPQVVVGEDLRAGSWITSPQLLPGGKALLFSSSKGLGSEATAIEAMALPDHQRKTISGGGTSPFYLADPNGGGYLLWLNKTTLFATRFDLKTLEASGTALPILRDVASSPGGTAYLSASRNGTLVYRRSTGENAAQLKISWLDGTERTQPLLARPGAYGRFSLSPDGQQVAVEISERTGKDIWVYTWQRDTLTRLTFTGNASAPLWTPDGRTILYNAAGEGLAAIRADGAGQPKILIPGKATQSPWSITSDGKRMAFQGLDSDGKFHLFTATLEYDGAGIRAGKLEVFLQESAAEAHHPVLSPDGRWLAYASAESGPDQIYVRAFPDTGGRWQISSGGGGYPMWSRTGRQLFFEAPDLRIMSVAYTVNGGTLAPDRPRVWSEKQLGGNYSLKNVELASDGKRFAALLPADESEGAKAAEHQVVFVENLLDELRRKLAAGK